MERYCKRCGQTKSLQEFYKRRGKEGSSPYCKPCMNEQTIERQRRFKELCIAYKGGACEHCGYSRYHGALEFHHRDLNEKDFTIAHARLTKFSDKVKLELDKCVLLCSNCHREEHARLKGLL